MFIVALPFGVLHGGYWGIVAMVGIAHICCHTGKILVECLYEPDETGCAEPKKIRFSYKEIAQAVFGGQVGGYLVLTAQLVNHQYPTLLALRTYFSEPALQINFRLSYS